MYSAVSVTLLTSRAISLTLEPLRMPLNMISLMGSIMDLAMPCALVNESSEPRTADSILSGIDPTPNARPTPFCTSNMERP